MNEAAAEARRQYKRKWSKEHSDKIKQYQENYWTRKAAEMKSDADKEDTEE